MFAYNWCTISIRDYYGAQTKKKSISNNEFEIEIPCF